MGLRKVIFSLITILVAIACSKDDLVYIDGNEAPPDHTIELITKENYVNKLYISILGRQASDLEFEEGLTIINQNNLSKSNRTELVNKIMNEEEYFHNEYEIIRNEILNSGDTSDVTLWISVFEQTKASTNNPVEIAAYDDYIAKLKLMQQIIPDLKSGAADFPEIHKRCVFNHFYDEINMGTENFVVSIFQNFLLRYPTIGELEAGKGMVDGTQTVTFLKLGENKEDFIDNFFSSNEYYEGQVRTAYLRFLFREPTNEEATKSASLYSNDLDFKQLQSRILISDEYVGI